MKRVALFGSTGSIGRNVLDIVDKNRDKFQVVLLSCHGNVEGLIEQATLFSVPATHIFLESKSELLKSSLRPGSSIFVGERAIEEIINEIDCELIVNAIVGSAGLQVSYYALQKGVNLALANKESLVAGGELLVPLAIESGAKIIPIDSEHSAIFQCLHAGKRNEVEKVILTASGGPFRNRDVGTFDQITVEEALTHPNWSMGPKITIDSATMMNKGLEVIEAVYLFDLTPEQIDIVIHPESIIHSMVQFIDGSQIAQMSPPDMRLPIAYALSFPDRLATPLSRTDFHRLGQLTFEKPDAVKFPAISLAYQAARARGLAPLTLNASNEIAVESFLARRLKFSDITVAVEKMLNCQPAPSSLSLENLLLADREIRIRTRELVDRGTLSKRQG